ncbi:hypothetical protein G9P44_004116 [Scheffersomyces stipitis]|nr:hypothetical protein G9P44_004116 [Scheffersomyces stipitis]
MLSARTRIAVRRTRLFVRYNSSSSESRPWMPKRDKSVQNKTRNGVPKQKKGYQSDLKPSFLSAYGRQNVVEHRKDYQLPSNLMAARKLVVPDSLKNQYKPFDFSKKSSEPLKQAQKKSHINKQKKEVDESRSKIKDIVKNSNRMDSEFFNPSNQTLDLRLNNSILYEQITGNQKDRMEKRYGESSKRWLNSFYKLLNQTSKVETYAEIKKSISKAIQESSISTANVHHALSVGDLVVFSEESITFAIVVGAPKNLESDTYTFVDSRGEVTFGPAKSFAYRFPGVIPSEYHDIISSFVQLEKKYLDIAPVGLTDMDFSKSTASLPQELQTDFPEDDKPRSLNDGINFSENTDFVVAQATSQLLTNSNVNTYIIPTPARDLYCDSLTALAVEVFDEVSRMKKPLENLHRLLQFDRNGDPLSTPRSISLFELLHYLEELESSSFEVNNDDISSLGQFIDPESSYTDKAFPVSKYLALLSSLRIQSRSWNVIFASKSLLPVSVTILPANRTSIIHRVLAHIKDGGDLEFSQYCLKKAKGEPTPLPTFYHTLVQLFKDYTIGNFTNDLALEAALVSIIRMVDEKQYSSENRPDNTYSYEYSRARAYDLLKDIGAIDSDNSSRVDPVHWSNALNLPGQNVSASTDISEDYMDFLNESLTPVAVTNSTDTKDNQVTSLSLNSFNDKFSSGVTMKEDFIPEDSLESIRKEFGETPIYCIDDADAHEVDDGISIHTSNDKYVLSVHVANPTSYIKPGSILNAIAFNRATTSYINEGAYFMFPKLISKLSGLGVDGQRTRTYAVQYSLDKKLIDSFVEKKLKDPDYEPPQEFCEQVLKQIDESIDVNFLIASRFPAGYTYNKVNEILGNMELIQSFKENRCNDEHFVNLYKLHNISKILKSIRHTLGGSFDYHSERMNVKIREELEPIKEESVIEVDADSFKLIPKNSTKSVEISKSSITSPSVSLVTEFMLFANSSSAKFADKNKIDFIYRSQNRKFNLQLIKEMEDKIVSKLRSGKSVSFEAQQILRVFSRSASLSTVAEFHDGVGIDKYGWVTSPLRRYVDVINHWNIASFLLQKAGRESSQYADEKQLRSAILHIQSKSLVDKRMQTVSNKFWLSTFLKEYTKMVNDKSCKIKPIIFKLLVVGRRSGYINVEMVGFGARGQLEVSPKLLEDYSLEEIEVGDTLESDRFRVSRIDFIEDTLELVYV